MRIPSLVAVAVFGCSCATAGRLPDRASVDVAMRAATGVGIRLNDTDRLPPSVTTTDGLSADEAVAIALWNNPGFQVTLADLGSLFT